MNNKESVAFEIQVNAKAASIEREDPQVKKRLEQKQ